MHIFFPKYKKKGREERRKGGREEGKKKKKKRKKEKKKKKEKGQDKLNATICNFNHLRLFPAAAI